MSARTRPLRSLAAIRLVVLAAALAVAACAARQPAAIPFGDGRIEAVLNGVALDVFTYKPATYDGGRMILVFHGSGRDAEAYRDRARVLGDRYRALIAAPLFDKARFPIIDYQRAGIVGGRPQSQKAGTLVLRLVDYVRRVEGRPDMDYLLIGHSAGGQFLSRFAAFVPNRAGRIVIANPSSYVAPTRDARFPYGFAEVPAPLAGDDAIRRYLASPITVFLGAADTGERRLERTSGAMRQGGNRHARGLVVFRMAEALARERGWPFGWRLVEVEGVGHDSRRMFASAECGRALFPASETSSLRMKAVTGPDFSVGAAALAF